MVRVIGTLFLVAFPWIGRSQDLKDLVFGNYSKEQIIASIKFEDSVLSQSFIKIDNMGNGDPFPILISSTKIVYVESIVKQDTIRVGHETLVFLIRTIDGILKNSSSRPRSYCGTFRIIVRRESSSDLYYVESRKESLVFFKRLLDGLSNYKKETKLLMQIKSIVRAMEVGMILDCN